MTSEPIDSDRMVSSNPLNEFAEGIVIPEEEATNLRGQFSSAQQSSVMTNGGGKQFQNDIRKKYLTEKQADAILVAKLEKKLKNNPMQKEV